MARALKQAGSTPKEGGQYVNVLFCFVFVLPKRVFYLEGGGRKPGQWERARARVRQTWGFFMGVYSGEAYGRRVRALQGEGRGFPLTIVCRGFLEVL